MKSRRVGIYLYPGVEVLDFAAPLEVFGTASRVALRSDGGAAPLELVTLVRRAAAVAARGGLRVTPDATIDAHPPLDLLIVPGGDERAERASVELRRWLAALAPDLELMASICTGAFLLAAAGLLDGRRVTTHWQDADELARLHPALRVEPQRRWIDEGRRVSSAGISAGLDMSLHLVDRLAGAKLAMATARQMDYQWHSEP